MSLIYGINPVREALRSGRVTSLDVADPSRPRLRPLVDLAEASGITVRRRTDAQLTRSSGGHPHQGVVAGVRPPRAHTLDDLLQTADHPLLVVLDGIEDPQNVGAILRTAEAAGVDGVVRQSRRAARLDGVAAKASAGAVAHLRIAEVVNIARTLEALKAAGVWTVGLDAAGSQRYDQIDLTLPTAVVLGAEGRGLRRLVRERCDWLVSIPMAGQVSSLNVSVAAGVALFEAVRQRAVAKIL
ncbi:MAG: 23S rRNA (guanosine(2251)-2'-O)-methyltransferase RlmB [Vicinamibacterales bacterium]|jgi:23S rRNA (guanosine2251-2'-O)-methyltransferase|nr:23S rRNA (guanosine(2251)-2'-O)-methyltransferase RlmB [Acidobacteriota bacterium]MDP7472223.1 23S rRNA (guanosine(2251)-2'-O)-methyltransferase RlmB [Vicinamibacterales bacterium]MDP7672097.1 23S rRNA (guanosine(2251)-2'-O)-methyltransferase RlmB [Vicinamibacterales bacterium]HJO39591.1 23S rRNA (guanosine(2251)-2'-O)-methyltransferase RlmB [Vicinamibacterales bacterium]